MKMSTLRLVTAYGVAVRIQEKSHIVDTNAVGMRVPVCSVRVRRAATWFNKRMVMGSCNNALDKIIKGTALAAMPLIGFEKHRSCSAKHSAWCHVGSVNFLVHNLPYGGVKDVGGRLAVENVRGRC